MGKFHIPFDRALGVELTWGLGEQTWKSSNPARLAIWEIVELL